MEILLNNFRNFLTNLNVSPVTIKNYLADIRRFLIFYQKLFEKDFKIEDSSNLTPEVIETFKENLLKEKISPPNINRYLSSLRRFCDFLKEKGFLKDNPALKVSNISSSSLDKKSSHPLEKILNLFEKGLKSEKINPVTIKNYLSDLRKFLSFLYETSPAKLNFPLNINSADIEEYKKRLSDIVSASPSSINRFCSSIKKFCFWAYKEGYLNNLPFPQDSFEPKPFPAEFYNPNLSATPAPVFPTLEKINQETKMQEEISKSLPPLPASPLQTLSFKPPFAKEKKQYLSPKTTESYLLSKVESSIYKILSRLIKVFFTPKLFWLFIFLLIPLLGYFSYQFYQSRLFLEKKVNIPSPRLISFQGVLKDQFGQPVTSAKNVVFKLYNSSDSLNPLWTSSVRVITPSENGNFSVVLGNLADNDPAIPSNLFADNFEVFLGIEIENEPELKPRSPLPNFAFSKNSFSLQGYQPNKEGLPETIPVLDENGALILAASSPKILSKSGIFSLEGQTIAIQTARGDIILNPENGKIDLQKAIYNSTSLNNGYVAINDEAKIFTKSDNPLLLLQQDGTGNFIQASQDKVRMFTVDH